MKAPAQLPLNLRPVSTGFFGIPGRLPHNSHSVHVVRNGKPICGTRMHPEAEYQWCADGVHTGYVECEKCKHAIGRAVVMA